MSRHHRRSRRFAVALTTALLGLSSACGGESRAAPAAERLELDGQLTPAPNRIVTGTLDPGKLHAIDNAGIGHIVSVQPRTEHPDFDEAAQAQALGIQHHHRPVADAGDLDRDTAAWLDAVLVDIGDAPVVLHCASGNRVGAVIALRAAWIEGMEAQSALDKGKRWGLTSLEPVVRDKLGMAAE